MEDILLLLESYEEIEDKAFEEFWACLNNKERGKIEELEWSNPRYLLEAKKLLKKKQEKKKKNSELSMKAKRISSKRKSKKQKTLNKASKVFEKLRKYAGKSKKETETYEESFVEYLLREEKENKIDSRGPRKLLVLSKDGREGLDKLELLAKTLYEDLGVMSWIEAGQEKPEEEREYGLFVSLSSYNSDEAKDLEKAVEKLVKA